jgi:hypothetical protein
VAGAERTRPLEEDQREVERVVRAYLQALAANAPRSRYVTGKLARIDQWYEQVSSDVRPLDPELEVTELNVEAIEGGEAVVSLAASLSYTDPDPLVPNFRVQVSYSRPVQVLRIRGSWKVAEHLIDGRPATAGAFFPNVTEKIAGITIRVPAIQIRAKSTVAFLSIRNEGELPVWGLDAHLVRFPRRPLVGRLFAPLQIPTGGNVTTAAFWVEGLPDSTRVLRFRLPLRNSQGETLFKFRARLGRE